LAQRHELRDAVGLDVALALEAEVALDVDLDPQALAVEPVLPALVLAEHGVVPLEQVLVGAAPGVVDAHRVVRGDGAVQEAPVGPARVLRAQSRERPPVAPLGQQIVLEGDEIRACGHRSEHRGPAILPAMQAAHETLPRGRSPFAAAFLSLLFPGLGHVYLSAYRRGLGFAAPVILFGALAAGFAVRMNVFDLAGLAAQPWFQVATFVGNLALLGYRGYAIVDAWSIARALSGKPARSTAAALRQAGVLSAAGLAAVLLVMSGVHVAVARYDILLQA